MRKKIGRPPKLEEADLNELVKKFEQYIDETAIPIVAEFAYLNNIERTYLYDRAEFSTLMKKCLAKKEAQLEIGSLRGQLNSTQAIFSLKQLGWKDKQEIDMKSEVSLHKVPTENLLEIEKLLDDEKDS